MPQSKSNRKRHIDRLIMRFLSCGGVDSEFKIVGFGLVRFFSGAIDDLGTFSMFGLDVLLTMLQQLSSGLVFLQ